MGCHIRPQHLGRSISAVALAFSSIVPQILFSTLLPDLQTSGQLPRPSGRYCQRCLCTSFSTNRHPRRVKGSVRWSSWPVHSSEAAWNATPWIPHSPNHSRERGVQCQCCCCGYEQTGGDYRLPIVSYSERLFQ